MKIAALIPVKKYTESKARLQNILSKDKRTLISKLMAERTVSELIKSNMFYSITIVTNDPELNINGTNSFKSHSSLNKALQEAIENLPQVDKVMIIHSDLPMINSKDIKNLLKYAKSNKLLIVSDSLEFGTNCLIYDSNCHFNLCFGLNSYQLFINEFQDRGIKFTKHNCKAIEQDLDSEEDYFKLISYLKN